MKTPKKPPRKAKSVAMITFNVVKEAFKLTLSLLRLNIYPSMKHVQNYKGVNDVKHVNHDRLLGYGYVTTLTETKTYLN